MRGDGTPLGHRRNGQASTRRRRRGAARACLRRGTAEVAPRAAAGLARLGMARVRAETSGGPHHFLEGVSRRHRALVQSGSLRDKRRVEIIGRPPVVFSREWGHAPRNIRFGPSLGQASAYSSSSAANMAMSKSRFDEHMA